jgi:hypothetical protein
MTYGHRWIHERFDRSKKYMTVDESIVTIGISGINGQVESGRKEVKGTT